MSEISPEERSENIRMIRESASFLTAPDRMEHVRARRHTMPGIDQGEWSTVTALGWLGMRLPDSGFGMAEFCALAEEMGRGLMPELVLQAMAIAPMLPDDVQGALLAGRQIVVPAWHERLGRPESLEAQSDGASVSGVKRFVPMAAAADAYLVTTTRGPMLVARDAAGVTLKTTALQDGGHFGEISFEGSPATALGGSTDRANEDINMGIAAYLLGISERTFAITREYLMTREQFGRPIGAFQALQHRMVDMYFQIQLARATIEKTAAILDRAAPDIECAIAVSRARARANDCAALVTREGVQMHGGMGYTDDCDIGLYLRKTMVLGTAFGASSWHRQRYARLANLANNRIAA